MEDTKLRKDLEKLLSQNQGVDFRRILGRIRRNWYYIVLSIFVGYGVAFIVNRYSTRIYQVKASIIIREEQEFNAGAELLYSNLLVNSYRNFFNEIYILKSYPLMKRVIDNLDFQVSYFREGNIKSSEIYKQAPFKVVLADNQNQLYGKTFEFEIRSNTEFELKFGSENNDIYSFGDTIDLNGASFLIQRESNSLEGYVDKKYRFRINNPVGLARSYSGRLGIEWAEEGASVVDFEVNSQIPQKAIDFLNTLINEYRERDLE